MADSPSFRGVIPLFPGAPPAPTRSPLSPEVMLLLRSHGAATLRFLSPALLLACGAAMVALVVASIARALGWTEAGVVAFAATVAAWTFLGAGGFAVAARGIVLALARWR
ncbi:MAG TPA: hypothetical protein VFE05_19085 [Longimicrobiaceae bacterium]|nr:hypothetical protein [Longimicrobiaceae bacterium]